MARSRSPKARPPQGLPDRQALVAYVREHGEADRADGHRVAFPEALHDAPAPVQRAALELTAGVLPTVVPPSPIRPSKSHR